MPIKRQVATVDCSHTRRLIEHEISELDLHDRA